MDNTSRLVIEKNPPIVLRPRSTFTFYIHVRLKNPHVVGTRSRGEATKVCWSAQTQPPVRQQRRCRRCILCVGQPVRTPCTHARACAHKRACMRPHKYANTLKRSPKGTHMYIHIHSASKHSSIQRQRPTPRLRTLTRTHAQLLPSHAPG